MAEKETTAVTTTVSNQVDTKKLEKGIKDLQWLYNSNIININKKNHWAIEKYSDEKIHKFVEKYNYYDLALELAKSHDTAIRDAFEDNRIAYLEKLDHEKRGTMQPKTKHEEYQEMVQAEFDSMKQEIAKLTKLVNKALNQEE